LSVIARKASANSPIATAPRGQIHATITGSDAPCRVGEAFQRARDGPCQEHRQERGQAERNAQNEGQAATNAVHLLEHRRGRARDVHCAAHHALIAHWLGQKQKHGWRIVRYSGLAAAFAVKRAHELGAHQ
jgi:hypothetical protein